MYSTFASEASQATAQWQKMMVDSWSQWTRNTIASDSFAAASSACMDWSLSTQKMLSDMSGQMMESLDIPKRSDLARLSSQIQAVESRLLDQEDANEELRSLLHAINGKLDRLATEQLSNAKAVEESAAKRRARDTKTTKS